MRRTTTQLSAGTAGYISCGDRKPWHSCTEFQLILRHLIRMNTFKVCFLIACLAAAVCATPGHKKRTGSSNTNLKPTQWLSSSELEALPSLDDITLQRLDNMPVEDGAHLIEQLYHLAQINHNLQPTFVPSPSNIPVYVIKPNGQNVTANLNTLVQTVKQQPNFGDEEVTIFITGLPSQQSEAVSKANRKLVQAYRARYYNQNQKQQDAVNQMRSQAPSSSEEGENELWNSNKPGSGNLIVVDLGATINKFARYALLDIEQTGAMVGKLLVQMTTEANVPHEIVHIVGQGVAAHVAGVAGRRFTRLTGQQVRRITGLDPAKIFAKSPNTVSGLGRGDADFVDAIHTSAYGMGVPSRSGDADFYPNGPAAGVPGANSVVDAAARATRYFAESVVPGNERNFPAVAANSLKQYQANNGNGQRAYMGIAAEYDLNGDYVLEVNPRSPFGQRAPAQTQKTYHANQHVIQNLHDDRANYHDYE